MTYLRLGIALLFILITGFRGFSQPGANKILQSVYARLQKANNYSVQANIKVDMPFIRMLPVDVTIYFKQKDKFKVESKSIAVVPRQGFDQASKLLADTNSFTSMIQGEEKLGTCITTIVNVIPLSDTSEMIFGKFWIDPVQSLIIKTQLTTRSSGTIVTEYFYGSQAAYGLPDQMIFSVDASKFKMPKNLSDEMKKNSKETQSSGNESKKGKIYITLTNYQVNKGIPDSVFEE
jgi:hypothetical protein